MFKMWVGSEITEKIVLGFLCLCAVFDLKKKEIPLVLVIIGIIGGVGFNVWLISRGMLSMEEMGISLLPGISFVLVGWGTKDKIGYGDGLVLFITGLFVGFYKCFLGVCIGLIFSAVFAVLLLIMHKAKKDSRIPFIPFLAIGMGVGMILGRSG